MGVSSPLLQVQRHGPEVVKGAKGTSAGEAEGQECRVEAIRDAASAGSPFSASAFCCEHRPVLRTPGLKGPGGKGNVTVFLFGNTKEMALRTTELLKK